MGRNSGVADHSEMYDSCVGLCPLACECNMSALQVTTIFFFFLHISCQLSVQLRSIKTCFLVIFVLSAKTRLICSRPVTRLICSHPVMIYVLCHHRCWLQFLNTADHRMHSVSLCVCVFVCVCVRACVCARAGVCVYIHVCVGMH